MKTVTDPSILTATQRGSEGTFPTAVMLFGSILDLTEAGRQFFGLQMNKDLSENSKTTALRFLPPSHIPAGK